MTGALSQHEQSHTHSRSLDFGGRLLTLWTLVCYCPAPCVSGCSVDLSVNASIRVANPSVRANLRTEAAYCTDNPSLFSLSFTLSVSLVPSTSFRPPSRCPPNSQPLPLPLFVPLSPYVVPSITFYFLFHFRTVVCLKIHELW